MKRHNLIIAVLTALVIVEAIIIFSLLPPAPAKKIVKPRPIPALKGKIAIVIDDWGYHQNTLDIVKQIKSPLTMSILPNLNYSTGIAESLHEMGFEIILHLPSEPFEKFRLEKDTVLTTMNNAEITSILNNDLLSVKFAKGVSNHMGSKLTSDKRAMSAIFKELSSKKLYFLDSFVSADSVCPIIAKETRIKFARRDVFLDNKEETTYIRRQINKLKAKARSKGFAIGIGHDRKITLETLKVTIPELEEEGFKFVFVSDLVN